MKELVRIIALAILAIVAGSGSTFAAGTAARATTDPDASGLLAQHVALAPRLGHNDFGRPLALVSQESPERVSGDVFAEIDSPFKIVSSSFATPAVWCDVLILHLNTKYCRAGVGARADRLSVRVGRKEPEDLDSTFALEFAFRLEAARPDYMAALLTSPSGPLGTRDYQIELQAVPLTNRKTFMRLHYAYSFGSVARLATQSYLAMGGSGKVGFTRVTSGDGKSEYVRGMRGMVERNTMRYYLAMESYLGSLAQPPGRQVTSRTEHWFDATEKYPLQLHELDRSTYLSMKQSEYARQQAVTIYH